MSNGASHSFGAPSRSSLPAGRSGPNRRSSRSAGPRFSSRGSGERLIGMNSLYELRGPSTQILGCLQVCFASLVQWLITNIEIGPSWPYCSWLDQPCKFWIDLPNLISRRAFSRADGVSAEHPHNFANDGRGPYPMVAYLSRFAQGH